MLGLAVCKYSFTRISPFGPSLTPASSSPKPEVVARRPVATINCFAVQISAPPFITVWTRTSPFARSTFLIFTFAQTRTFSPSRYLTIASPISGSSAMATCGPPSSTMTFTPKRVKSWGNSRPIAPPPTIISDSGSSFRSSAWVLSIYPVSSSTTTLSILDLPRRRCSAAVHDRERNREMPDPFGTIPGRPAGAVGSDRATSVELGVGAGPAAGRRAQIHRTDGGSPARGQRASPAAVDRPKPMALGSGLGTLGPPHDGRAGARPGVGPRRHRIPQTGAALRGRRAAIFGPPGQDRELPGGGEPASGRGGRKYDSGLAALLAGKLGWGSGAANRSGNPRDGGVPNPVATGSGTDRRGASLGLEGRRGSGRCRLRRGDGVSRRAGSPSTSLCSGDPLVAGRMDQAAPSAPTESAGARTPAECLSLRRPTPRLGARGGGKGPRLEASALARRHERLARVALLRLPRPALARLQRRPATPQGSWAADRMARRREGTHEILSLRPADSLYPAAAGAHRQKPLESRTGLPATQGGTGTGPLRRPQLGGLASSRHAGDAGARFPDPGKNAQQKKLLGGPCHRRAVKSNACCSPGLDTARIAVPKFGEASDSGIPRPLSAGRLPAADVHDAGSEHRGGEPGECLARAASGRTVGALESKNLLEGQGLPAAARSARALARGYFLREPGGHVLLPLQRAGWLQPLSGALGAAGTDEGSGRGNHPGAGPGEISSGAAAHHLRQRPKL